MDEGCHVIFDGGIDIPVVKYLSFMLFVKWVTFSVVWVIFVANEAAQFFQAFLCNFWGFHHSFNVIEWYLVLQESLSVFLHDFHLKSDKWVHLVAKMAKMVRITDVLIFVLNSFPRCSKYFYWTTLWIKTE